MNKVHPGHPDDETIAEFLDGRLAPERHAEVLAHLDACPSCFELLAELGAYRAESAVEDDNSGKVLPFPTPPPRARNRWVLRGLAVAASLALVAGVVGWFGRGADLGPTGTLVASLAASPASLADLRLVVVEGGTAGFTSRSPEARAVLAGATLVDLAILARSDAPDPEDLCVALAALVPGACEHGRDLATLERRALTDLPASLVEFGAWAEAVRLAAATNDRNFLTRQVAPRTLHDPTLLADEAAPELLALAAAWERAQAATATDLDHASLASAAKNLLVVL